MAWVDSIFKFLSLARYNTVAPSLANGDQGELQVDQNANLKVVVGGTSYDGTRLRVQLDPSTILWFASSAIAAATVVKASAGKVHELQITNPGAVDTVAWVTDGSNYLHAPVKVKAGESVALSFPGGRPFSTGLTVTCADNFTAPPSASATEKYWVSAKYE